MAQSKSAPRSWNDYKQTMSSDVDIPDFRGFTPLMIAAYRGNLAELQKLLERGASPNFPDTMGNTPLMGVAFKGNVGAAKILLSAGAGLRTRNHAGLDAYDIAASFGRRSMVKLFTERGVESRKVARLKTLFRLLSMGVVTAFTNAFKKGFKFLASFL